MATEDIGVAILGPLSELDPVAYLRFASVYKHYDSADDFLDEIARMRPSATQSVEGRDDGPDLSAEQNCQPALAL